MKRQVCINAQYCISLLTEHIAHQWCIPFKIRILMLPSGIITAANEERWGGSKKIEALKVHYSALSMSQTPLKITDGAGLNA